MDTVRNFTPTTFGYSCGERPTNLPSSRPVVEPRSLWSLDHSTRCAQGCTKRTFLGCVKKEVKTFGSPACSRQTNRQLVHPVSLNLEVSFSAALYPWENLKVERFSPRVLNARTSPRPSFHPSMGSGTWRGEIVIQCHVNHLWSRSSCCFTFPIKALCYWSTELRENQNNLINEVIS